MDKKTILAVDDQKSNRSIIKSRLQDEYNVIPAADGKEALAIVRDISIDLILLDVMLGDQNGIDICRSIKQNAKSAHIPVIILSSISDQAKIEESFKAGACDYIIKNFDANELKLRIHNQLKLAELATPMPDRINPDNFKQELSQLSSDLEAATELLNKSYQYIQRIMERY